MFPSAASDVSTKVGVFGSVASVAWSGVIDGAADGVSVAPDAAADVLAGGAADGATSVSLVTASSSSSRHAASSSIRLLVRAGDTAVVVSRPVKQCASAGPQSTALRESRQRIRRRGVSDLLVAGLDVG